MFRRLLTCLLIAAPTLCSADKSVDKTLELLREMGALQDQIKAFQQSMESKLAQLGQSNADQTNAAVEQVGKATAALGDRLTKGLQDGQEQQNKALAAVASLSSQLQAVAGDLSTMRQAMNDLTSSISKLSTQVGDLNNAVKSVQSAKPLSGGSEVSAADLFASAEGDRLGGKFDLALQEYAEFATKFANDAQAPDAEYYIGSIHYSNKEWEEAVKAFDMLLQSHPESKKVPEALYYKGDSLARLGRWPEADAALKDLRKKFPTNGLAKQSLNIKPAAH